MSRKHLPDPAAWPPKTHSGRSVLKPLARDKTRFQPVIFVAAAAGTLVALIVAFLLRGQDPNIWILGAGALLLAPPIVLAGYTAMRDAESEPYRGRALWLRAAVVAAVYAGFVGHCRISSACCVCRRRPELWQLIPPTAIMIVAGTIAAMATLDLEPINAFFHYAFYLAATVLLRVVIGLPPLAGGARQSRLRPRQSSGWHTLKSRVLRS